MQGAQSHPSLQALGLVPGARRRVWSLLLALGLAIASFMHVAHTHDADALSIYKQHCTFCSTFDRGGAPPPVVPAALPASPLPSFVVAASPVAEIAAEFRPSCRPRAPPFLQA